MALQDHFHDPLRGRRHWQGFHHSWATLIALDLNRRLPERYFAEPSVQFGIEIDVSTWEEAREPATAARGESGGGARRGWTPPAPTRTVPFTLVTDAVEVHVFDTQEGPVLVGAVELVSPANKDRPETREAFVAKCKALLQAGLGLVLVDIVTERKANLHADLLGGQPESDLYAIAYRPVGHEDRSSLEIWSEALAVGSPLPTLPLWLRGGPCMPLDLESTYEQARVGMRLPG
jgi:hypothetical protein